jgi:acyl-CoA synthetase (AMP-forming)/AMP-acid ligase II
VNVVSLFRKAAKTHEQRVALRHAGMDSTYGELDERTDRIGAGLLRLGLRPRDRVVLWIRNRPELVELLLAGWKANLTVVPVNVRLHPKEVAYVVANCDAAAFAYDSSLGEAVATIDSDIESRVARLQVGGDAHAAVAHDHLASCPERVMEDASDDDVAWLFYTSGTTGKPKGAMLTHRNLISMTMNCLADICSFQPEDVVLHAAPLTHGSGLYLPAALARGSLNVISHHPSFEPIQIFELIATNRVTVIAFLAPTMIARLIKDPALGSSDLSTLRCVPYGGGPMYVEQVKRAIDLLGPIWVQIYGQGETPMTGTYLRPQEHRYDSLEAERRLGSAGITRTDIELRVVDLEGREVPDGEVGEIAIRGVTVMKGYWDDPSATQEALRDGWLHTGDLGYMDADGYVFIVDRAKDMIISGGNNVYPREVEEVLLRHPQIVEAAVVGIPDPDWGESVHAVIVTRPEAMMTVADVIELCRANLAGYKKPRSVEFVAELPKNAYGKVLKRELREKYWAGHDRRIGGGSGAVARPREQ